MGQRNQQVTGQATNHFEPPNPLNMAILFLIFNRPDTTRQVFEAIRQAKPPRLYVAADGPRKKRTNEKHLCEEVREIAMTVNWPCDVYTLFREENLGCRHAVSSAIDWFFKNEEQGIILEDDCLPSQSFFWYCQELLEYYKNDSRIMVVSGNNFQAGNSVTPYSYYFSRYNHCWGWATWRRAWEHYDREMNLWPDFQEEDGLQDISGGSRLFVKYWQDKFNAVATHEIDSWAYVWTFSCWAQRGLTCLPLVNLVQNIGFGEDATHTTKTNRGLHLETYEMPFHLQHPHTVYRHITADNFTDKHHFRISWISILCSVVKDKISFLPDS